MKCRSYEKWMSDFIDQRLSQSREARLKIHLEECPSCRSYLRRIKTLQEEIGRIERTEVKSEHLHYQAESLRFRLQTFQAGMHARQGMRSWQERKPDWRWGLAGSTVIAVLFLFFLILPQHSGLNGDTILFLSPENVVNELLEDMGDDPQLQHAFNLMVLASIDISLEEVMPGRDFPLVENPLLLDDLSQEELEYLESEIKKLMKS